jgi:hypothetical protein
MSKKSKKKIKQQRIETNAPEQVPQDAADPLLEAEEMPLDEPAHNPTLSPQEWILHAMDEQIKRDRAERLRNLYAGPSHFLLRMSGALAARLQRALEARPSRISKNSWIIEAIDEKLKRAKL